MKANYKHNTDPNSNPNANPNTKQTLVLIEVHNFHPNPFQNPQIRTSAFYQWPLSHLLMSSCHIYQYHWSSPLPVLNLKNNCQEHHYIVCDVTVYTNVRFGNDYLSSFLENFQLFSVVFNNFSVVFGCFRQFSVFTTGRIRRNVIRDSNRVQFPSFPHLQSEYQRSSCLTFFTYIVGVQLCWIYYTTLTSHVMKLIQYVGCLVNLVRSTRHTVNSSHVTSWWCDELTGSRWTLHLQAHYFSRQLRSARWIRKFSIACFCMQPLFTFTFMFNITLASISVYKPKSLPLRGL